MTLGDRLFGQWIAGCAPLIAWAAHLGFCYVLIAMGCALGLDEMRIATLPAIRLALIAATLLALAVIVLTMRRAWHAYRQPAQATRVVPVACLTSGALALVAVAWSAMPMLVLRACGSLQD